MFFLSTSRRFLPSITCSDIDLCSHHCVQQASETNQIISNSYSSNFFLKYAIIYLLYFLATKFGSITHGTPRDAGFGDRSHHQEYGERHPHHESTYNGRWEEYKQISQDAKSKHKHQDLHVSP